MLKKVEERKQIAILRKQGLSILKIAKILKVSKGLVSSECKDIPLSQEQKNNLRTNTNYGNLLARNRIQENAKKLHDEWFQQGFELAIKDENFRILCALYWGEGCKVQGTVYITNSDLKIIKYLTDWLIYNGLKEKIRFSILFHDCGKSEMEICEYWLNNLGLDISNQRKHFMLKYSNSSRKKKHPYGFCKLGVSSTKHWFIIMGGINYISSRI